MTDSEKEDARDQERQIFAASLSGSIDSPVINDMFSSSCKRSVQPAKNQPANIEPDKVEPAKDEPPKAEPVEVKRGKGPFGWEHYDWMEEELLEHPTPRTRDLWYKIFPPKPTTVECPKCGTDVDINK
jgi:hypothetical protein